MWLKYTHHIDTFAVGIIENHSRSVDGSSNCPKWSQTYVCLRCGTFQTFSYNRPRERIGWLRDPCFCVSLQLNTHFHVCFIRFGTETCCTCNGCYHNFTTTFCIFVSSLWAVHNWCGAFDTKRMTQITKFMRPTWGPPGSCRPHVGHRNLAIRGYSSAFDTYIIVASHIEQMCFDRPTSCVIGLFGLSFLM